MAVFVVNICDKKNKCGYAPELVEEDEEDDDKPKRNEGGMRNDDPIVPVVAQPRILRRPFSGMTPFPNNNNNNTRFISIHTTYQSYYHPQSGGKLKS